MKETRILEVDDGYCYHAQYKHFGMWWYIYDIKLPYRSRTFMQKSSAQRAIDKFIANGYKQFSRNKIIKYPEDQ